VPPDDYGSFGIPGFLQLAIHETTHVLRPVALLSANVADRVIQYSEFPQPEYRIGNDRLRRLFPPR
jgi:hypothetical protein